MNTSQNNSFQGKRRVGRILAFQFLFAYSFSEKSFEELFNIDWIDEQYDKESFSYARFLIAGTIEHLDEIDGFIISNLKNWEFSRISNIDKAILRFSIFSLLYEEKLSAKVIINEAIEIIKIFGDKDSYKFINGLLDAVKKNKGISK